MRLNAFISYNHASDFRIAAALERGLRRLAVPLFKKPVLTVFRDDTSLASTPAMWSAIQGNLDESDYLVVLLSRSAAASYWVDREVAHWRKTKPADHILTVLTEGECTWDRDRNDYDEEHSDAVPPALRGAFREEPLSVDLRWAREAPHLDLRRPRFRHEVARLAAPLRGASLQELDSEDDRIYRHNRRLRGLAVMSLALLTVAALVAAGFAVNQQRRAERQARVATSRQLAATAITELRDRSDVALALGAEAYQTAPTVQARQALLAGLLDETHLLEYLHSRLSYATSVAFSPDGRLLAAGGRDTSANGTAVVWDVVRGVPAGPPAAFPGLVQAVAFADGQVLVVGGGDIPRGTGYVERRRVTGWARVGTTFQLPQPVQTVAVSRDGHWLAAGTGDTSRGTGTLALWRFPDGARAGVTSDVGGEVSRVAFSPDGRTLASGGGLLYPAKGSVRFWQVPGLRPRTGVGGGTRSYVGTLAFSPSGDVVASDGTESDVLLWTTRAGKRARQALTAPQEIVSLAFSPDGSRLVGGLGDHTVVVWDVHTHRLLPVRLGHSNSLSDLAFDQRTGLLATAAADGTVRLWALGLAGMGGRPPMGLRLDDPAGKTAFAAAFSPDGRVLASGGAGDRITLWSPSRAGWRGRSLKFGHSVRDLVFSPDGHRLAAGGGDLPDDRGVVLLWDLQRGAVASELPAKHTHLVKSVAFSPDGTLLASASSNLLGSDGEVLLWDVGRSALRRRLAGHAGGVGSVAFSPTGGLLAAGDRAGNTLLWDVVTGERRGVLRGAEPSEVGKVAFSPDGRYLAAGHQDGSISRWDLKASPPKEALLLGHTEAVTGLAFTPDGHELWSTTFKGNLGLWDARSALPLLLPVATGSESAWAVAVARRGGGLVVALAVETGIVLWDGEVDSWFERACELANRDLSRREWDQYVGADVPYRQTCAPVIARRPTRDIVAPLS
jgi:WD40 repeat protein